MARRAFGALVVVLLVVLAVAGCGGGHAVRTSGHPCSARDATMGCVLAGVAPNRGASAAPRGRYGIDFAWSTVSAGQAKALGARFGASYLSTDASKNWTQTSVHAYHAAGLATVAVWETSSTRAEDGYAAGAADAQAALAQATALGDKGSIDFAVDCECTGPSVLGYFQGVHSILGSRDDAYGDYSVILYLYQHGVVGHENWQTYAWSDGQWLPASIAPLEQYLNGSSFDNDRALRPLYGQWPVPKPANPVCFTHRVSRSACGHAKAQVVRDLRAAASSDRAYVARGCGVLSQRVRWFSSHLRRHPRVKTEGRRSALRASQRAYRQRFCRVFAQRERFFTNAATLIRAAN